MDNLPTTKNFPSDLARNKSLFMMWIIREIYEPIVARVNSLMGGASGTFTTPDTPAKTITVKNGIITKIV
jgi:hypothetical protein